MNADGIATRPLPPRTVGERLRAAARPAVRLETIAIVAALLAIVAVAVLLRFVDLATNPGGLYTDEGAEALDASRLLHWQGIPPVWFESDGGREALFAYLVAGAFWLFGQTILVLRETSAALGIAGLLAIGHLGRRFGAGVGLAAAAWAAGSLWLVAVSRDGMRNNIVPLFGALALIALLRWQAAPSRRNAALAGAVASLAALYTYQPLKLLPVLVAVWLYWLRRADRDAFEALWRDVRAFVLAFIAVAVPMAIVAVVMPFNYFGRMAAVTPVNPEVDAATSPLVHVLRTIGMFTMVGDPNARHDVAGIPLLGPPVLAWPLLVVALAGVYRLWRRRTEPAHALVLLALPIFILPPLVAIEGGSPHFLRTLGLAAPLGVTIGLGARELVSWARRVGSSLSGRWALPGTSARRSAIVAGWAAAGLVVCLLGAQAVASGSAYFSRPVADRYGPYDYDTVAMASIAGPGDAIVADIDTEREVRFLDAARLPDIYSNPASVAHQDAYRRILSVDPSLLAGLGGSNGGPPRAVAWAPDGSPSVWAVEPAKVGR